MKIIPVVTLQQGTKKGTVFYPPNVEVDYKPDVEAKALVAAGCAFAVKAANSSANASTDGEADKAKAAASTESAGDKVKTDEVGA